MVFKADIIGLTIITGTYNGQVVVCEVTVILHHKFFRVPLTVWDSGMQTVKDYEARSLMEFVNFENRLDYVKEAAHILDMAYIFQNDKLQQILIVFTRTPDLYEQVINFYEGRYIYEHTINHRLIFVNRDKKLSIALKADRFQIPQPNAIEVIYSLYIP